MVDTLTIASVQMDVALGDLNRNADRICGYIRDLAARGVALAGFPECALSGYCFDSLEEARQAGQDREGAFLRQIAVAAADSGIDVVFGFLELAGDDLFNSAALVTRRGTLHVYRKVHLPYLGVDRFTTPGASWLDVVDLGAVRVGVNICYDCSFPESSRVLALRGADLIVLPTNWPPGADTTAEWLPPARALENHVYYMAINRVGRERDFHFIGRSQICHPEGHRLAIADHDREEILSITIEPGIARDKHLVRVPGKHEIDRFADRRPDLYGDITGRSG